MKKGFTLLEVMAVVVIISILTAIALPVYTRSIERSRAVEAMNNIKAINDAIYMYYADKEACPTKFSQLVVSLPTANLKTGTVAAKYFTFSLDAAATVPGTICSGAKAQRDEGGYKYFIYNPFVAENGKASSLKCVAEQGNTKSQAVCDALGF